MSLCGLVFAVALLATACADVHEGPDEFAVVPRAPLSLPPDYGLRPPRPGAARPQEATAEQLGRKVVVGDRAAPGAGKQTATAGATGGGAPAPSAAEQSLLRRSGTEKAQAGIRELLHRGDQSIIEAGRKFSDQLIAWGGAGTPAYTPPANRRNLNPPRIRRRGGSFLGIF